MRFNIKKIKNCQKQFKQDTLAKKVDSKKQALIEHMGVNNKQYNVKLPTEKQMVNNMKSTVKDIKNTIIKDSSKNNQHFINTLNKYPYHQKQNYSNKYVNKNGEKLIQHAVHYFENDDSFVPDSRILGFKTLHKYSHFFVKIMGIVADYRIIVHHGYPKIFLLLKNVVGKNKYNWEYLTNHIWIDNNISNKLTFEDGMPKYNATGIGDLVKVVGIPFAYHGKLGSAHGTKISLIGAVIRKQGYPEFKHQKFQYDAIPYYHHKQCLYYFKNGCMYLGNEISNKDKEKIKHAKYFLDDIIKEDMHIILQRGFRLNNNYYLVIFHTKIKGSSADFIKWTKRTKSTKNAHKSILTSAFEYRKHPNFVEDRLLERFSQVPRTLSSVLEECMSAKLALHKKLFE